MTIEHGLGAAGGDSPLVRRGVGHLVEGSAAEPRPRVLQLPVTVGGVVAIVIGLAAFRGLSSPDPQVQATAATAALVTAAALTAAVLVAIAVAVPRVLRHRTLRRSFPDAILVTGQWDRASYRAATGEARATSRSSWTLAVTDEGAELWEGGIDPRRAASWPRDYVGRVTAEPAKHSLQNAAVLVLDVDGRSIPLRPLKNQASVAQWMDAGQVTTLADAIRDRLNQAR